MSRIAHSIVLIGALNTGLIGLGELLEHADWNIIHLACGSQTAVEATIYVVIGVAGMISLASLLRE